MAERWVVDNDISSRYPIYTRGNVGEVFPDPVAPLTWTIGGIPGSEEGWRDALVRFGAFDRHEFSPDQIEILGVFGGYCYLNVSVSRIFGVRTPGLTPELVDYSLFGEQSDVLPYQAHPSDESSTHTARVEQTLGWVLTVEEIDELIEERARIQAIRDARPDFVEMSDGELVQHVKGLFGEHFRRLFAQHLFMTYGSMVGTGIVATVCGELGDPTMAMRLLSGVGGVDSAAPSWAMWELGRTVASSASLTAAFDSGADGLLERLRADDSADARSLLADFDDFIGRFGSRGPNEWEMRCPTWETRPELALTAIDRMRLSPEDAAPNTHQSTMVADRERLTATVTEQLASNPEAQAQFVAGLTSAQRFLAARERSKTTIVMLVHECRMAMHVLGRRMVAAGHFDKVESFGMLTVDELDAFLDDPGAFRETIAHREIRFAELSALEPPFVLNGEAIDPDTWARRDGRPVEQAKSGTVLTGIPGCPGEASGIARVILDPMDAVDLDPGDVLIAPSTDPSWTPLFVPAAAVVVDVGAQLSHAIIVCRELGIPCVVSVTDATRRISDGAKVRVDGTTGTVTVL